jgi:hypothetical protein
MEDQTLKTLITIGGSAAVAGIVVQIVKKNIKDWRYTNFLVIGIGILLAIAAQIAISPTYGEILIAAVNGLLGAGLATLSYETIENSRGLAGKGSRSNEKIIERAEKLVGVKSFYK